MEQRKTCTKPSSAIILAAGYGIRMVPINTEQPKGLLEIHGQPLIERLIQQLQSVGIEKTIIVVVFLKEEYEYLIGGGSTLLSFIILGNCSMGLQFSGIKDFIQMYLSTGDLYAVIVAMIQTFPFSKLFMLVILVTMIAFYATSFDSIALTASCYSYRKLEGDEMPAKTIQLLWCILLILLPICLLFAESSMNSLQTVSIVAAFPIGFVIILIVLSFLKDAGEN